MVYLHHGLLSGQNILKNNKKMFTTLLKMVLYHFKIINYNCIAKRNKGYKKRYQWLMPGGMIIGNLKFFLLSKFPTRTT